MEYSTQFSFLWWGILVYLNWSGKMKIACFLVILEMVLCSLGIGCVLIWALPKGVIVQGQPVTMHANPMPHIPFAIATVIVLMALVTIIFSGKDNTLPEKTHLTLRWFLLIIGVILQVIGVFFALVSFIVPNALGHENSVPQIGIYGFFIFSVISCVLFYLSSRMNSAAYPNLFRWIVFWVVGFACHFPVTIGLLFIYTPNLMKPPAMYPYLTGFISFGFLPYGIVMMLLSRQYLKQKTN